MDNESISTYLKWYPHNCCKTKTRTNYHILLLKYTSSKFKECERSPSKPRKLRISFSLYIYLSQREEKYLQLLALT